jgi:hypothetical protein
VERGRSSSQSAISNQQSAIGNGVMMIAVRRLVHHEGHEGCTKGTKENKHLLTTEGTEDHREFLIAIRITPISTIP